MDIKEFKQQPIIGILRGIQDKHIEPLFEAVYSAGLKTIEITMNTQGAYALIKKTSSLFGSRLVIGAGTVTDMDSLNLALKAGASFIVMPTLVKDVVNYCVKNKIPVFPGALSPQEIFNAWNAGSSMVKVFPAKFFGPEYFKEIKGPFDKIELLACGGVTPENIKDFFDAGASAAAIGGSTFKKEMLDKGEYNSIASRIKKYIRQRSGINH